MTGCSAELQRPSCDSGCLSERYRSITGECNNRLVLTLTLTHTHVDAFGVFLTALALFRQHPRRGAANTPYSRWLPPEYEDAWGSPRGWDPEHTYHNFTLPPVRACRSPPPPPVLCPIRYFNSRFSGVCRCGWSLRSCCSLTMVTSRWTPPCPTCWWSGVSGSTMTSCRRHRAPVQPPSGQELTARTPAARRRRAFPFRCTTCAVTVR